VADPLDQLTSDAARPKKAKTETAEVERHSLPDQIAAAKFILGQAAGRNPSRGLRFNKFKPPGMVPGVSVSPDGDPAEIES
jgi:hypothetical protein